MFIFLAVILSLFLIQRYLVEKGNNEKQELQSQLLIAEEKIQSLENRLQQQQIIEIQQNKTAEKPDNSTIKLLKDFGYKWTNYHSIYDRNQSVKSFLTNRAIEEYTIDVDPKVEYKAEGKIYSVFKDTETNDRFLIFGEEKVNGEWNKILLEVIVADNQKIDDLSINYMRQVQ
ncbi:EF0163 family protein [Enterococcus sp. S52]|uniref:EF0163 family protein n=1 Tax=Enterococcus sp. S52 TaxID=2767452 RepID=UPI001F4011B2|nr:EF0163 family protein [Enterococcus sp. S52]